MLFEYVKNENPNDPFLINPKGIRVQVPFSRVGDLLSKGFKLEDDNWEPPKKIERLISHPNPFSGIKTIKQLREEIAEEIDVLEVTEL